MAVAWAEAADILPVLTRIQTHSLGTAHSETDEWIALGASDAVATTEQTHRQTDTDRTCEGESGGGCCCCVQRRDACAVRSRL